MAGRKAARSPHPLGPETRASRGMNHNDQRGIQISGKGPKKLLQCFNPASGAAITTTYLFAIDFFRLRVLDVPSGESNHEALEIGVPEA